MNSGINWLGVIFRAMHCMAQRLGHTKIRAEVFFELWNVMLDGNGKDKIGSKSK